MNNSSSEVSVCVVGLGHWGPNLVRSFENHPAVKNVVAVEPSQSRVAVVKERLPHIKIYSDLKEALNDDNISCFAVATPTATHFKVGMEILSRGKHLLMEKPLAHNRESAEILVRTARENNCILMTGHVFLFNNGIIEMKRLIDEGSIGRVMYARSLRTNLGPIRKDVDALWDLATHDISIFNYIFDSTPAQVSCTKLAPLGLHQYDLAQATLIYPNNRSAMIFVSWLDPQKKREITVVGAEKMVVFDDMKPEAPLAIYEKGVTVEQERTYFDTFESFRLSIFEGNVTVPEVKTGQPLSNECCYFIDTVLGRKPLKCDGEEGKKVVEILEALDLSASQGGKLVSLW